MKLFTRLLTRKFITVVFMMLFLLPAFSQNKLIGGKDRVVKVNNRIITMDELLTYFDMLNKLMPSMTGRELTKKEVLDMMIDEELLQQRVRRENIIVDESQVQNEINSYKMQYVQLMRQKDPNFQFSQDKFESYIEQEGDVSYDNFVEKIRTKAQAQKFVQQIAMTELQKVYQKTYNEAELKQFRRDYLQQFVQPDSVEVKHIFLKTISTSGNELSESEQEIVRKKAQDIKRRLDAGEDFDELCLLTTEDPGSRDAVNQRTGKLDRGYVGVIPISGEDANKAKKMFGTEIYNALFTMKEGEISKVMKSQLGYHIFKVSKKLSERIVPFEEARSQIVEFFRQRDQQEVIQKEYAKLVEELKRKAEITYYKNEFK